MWSDPVPWQLALLFCFLMAHVANHSTQQKFLGCTNFGYIRGHRSLLVKYLRSAVKASEATIGGSNTDTEYPSYPSIHLLDMAHTHTRTRIRAHTHMLALAPVCSVAPKCTIHVSCTLPPSRTGANIRWLMSDQGSIEIEDGATFYQ